MTKIKDRKRMTRDSYKWFSRVSRLGKENHGFSALEITQPKFTCFGDYLENRLNPLRCNPYEKWADRSTMSEFSIPYLPEPQVKPATQSQLTEVQYKTVDDILMVFSENRPRGKELQEIIGLETEYMRTQSKEQAYKSASISFSKTSMLFRMAAIEYERYKVKREFIRCSEEKMKSLPSIPVFNEQHLSKSTRRLLEIRDKEYQREKQKLENEESRQLTKIEDIVRNTSIKLKEIGDKIK